MIKYIKYNKYSVHSELKFTGVGKLINSFGIFDDKCHIFNGGETVEINSVVVTGWNTRVTFTIVQVNPWHNVQVHPHHPFKGLVGYVDFKNEICDEESCEVKANFIELK